MKWCCSRYTTGVAIGSIYIVVIVLFFISTCVTYVHYDKVHDPQRRDNLKSVAIKSMIVCAVSVIISALFIVAIVKRYKYLIIPWLLLVVYYFCATCMFIFAWFIGAGMGGASGLTFLLIVAIGVLAIVIQIAIFWFSCSLFREIHLEYKEHTPIPKSDPMTERSFV
ncbi:uncharacterized protein LOC119613140 [Lucilia sericata]|uniref:uncharacterized protein LOC119613140 n=1 Tax=Lucilia sericata TaxID=13632 RepID=UPI0018A7FB9F|nr:uncharacterized protein LOC119613140 [Lucilia sericata]